MGKRFHKVLAGILALAMLLSAFSFDLLTLEGKQSKENQTEATEWFDTDVNEEEERASEEGENPAASGNDAESENPDTSGTTPEEEIPAETEQMTETAGTAEAEKPTEEGDILQDAVSAEQEKDGIGSDEGKSSEETETAAETEKDESMQQASYTLHIVHTLRFQRNGQGRHVQEHKEVRLTDADFEDGGYDLMRQAYVHEALTAALAKGYPERILASDFRDDGKGGKVFDAEIRYTLKEGWNVRFPEDAGYHGASFYGVYEGSFDGAEFTKANHITVTVQYKYSNTGGLAGIDAHAPDVIELLLDDNGTVDLTDWQVPHYEETNPDYHGHSHENLKGFRIVLDPEPLNQFVKNPNGTLENGDFNLRDDVDTESREYQEAWDAARRKAAAGKSGKEVLFSYIAPVENGGTSQTTSDDPDKIYRLNASGLTEDVTLTVYYRRDAGNYTVNHWKPAEGVTNPVQGNAQDWSLIESKEFPGRAGMLTDAKVITDSRVTGYTPAAFSQETINPDGSTEINIYYTPKIIRVIFDTDDIYIERQQVPVGGYVEFGSVGQDELDQAKDGYRFAGWQYRPQDGNENDRRDIFPADAETTNRFLLTQEFLNNAWIDDSVENTGIEVLRLYPKWEPAKTPVRVVFWTEDLNGQDVEVTNFNYNFNTKQKIPGATAGGIVHQTPGVGTSFSNAASFELQDTFETGEKLVESGKLTDKLQTEINNHLNLLGSVTVSGTTGTPREVPVSDFFKQYGTEEETKGYNILVEKVNQNGEVTEEESTTAAANGSTLVYVYFKRNVYRLDFEYYFQMPHDKVSAAQEGKGQIITETSWFSNSNNWTAFENGTNYSFNSGCFQNVEAQTVTDARMPMTTAISAKYGADLREVWPADDTSRYLVGGKLRVSWATTSGLHNALTPGGNVNVPGAYSTMNAAIVADAKDNTKTHHLVAFWTDPVNNAYRYNYCYEVPELTPEEAESCSHMKIYNDTSASAEEDIKNTIYLVPKNHKAFLKYGFTDLLKLNEAVFSEGVSFADDVSNPGDYYAVRIYNGKCYALSRQLVALSALAIDQQNPSARPHLTLVNDRTDHSTEISGGGSATAGYNSFQNPYDVYFYYTRDRFTITYMSDETTEIGQLELPYGTALSADKYAYELDYKKTNGDYAAPDYAGGWSLSVKRENGNSVEVDGNLPVCPKRSPDGTRAWKFNGWALGPAGVRMMQWGDEVRNIPIVLESNLRLYAAWEAPQYKVTFDWNHGVLTGQQEQEEALIREQIIPGNRSFITHGVIPRPFRDKFILSGWVITARGDGEGNKTEVEPVNGAYPQFLFDQPITQDLWVKAVWDTAGEIELSYTVHYLVQGTDIPVREPKTITGTYLPGTAVWAGPEKPTQKGYENYIPLTQNQSVILSADTENKIIFYYVPPSAYDYTVKFDIWNTQETVLELTEKTEKVSLQVCPTTEHIRKLNELGYYIVDPDGKRVTTGSALAQSIAPGERQETVTYYVLPDTYTITYQNMEIMGDEAGRLQNPVSYTTAEGAGKLNNPTGTYTDARGSKVRFAGWRMINTREVSGIRDFDNGKEIAESVTIAKGSRGNLIFSAVWHSDSDSNKPTPSGTPDKPGTSKDREIPEKPEKTKNPTTPVESGSGDSAVTPSSPNITGLGLPQTGSAWWLVYLLAGLGTLMLMAGLMMKERVRKG